MISKDSTQEVSSFYDERGKHAIATRSARQLVRHRLHISAPYEAAFKQIGQAPPGGTLLDIGCGTGISSVQLAKQGWKITGIDISKESIEASRALAEQEGVAELCTYSVSSIESFIGSNSKKFDVIFAAGVLYYLAPDLRKTVVRNLLSPKGRLVFVEPLGDSVALRIYRHLRARIKKDRDQKSLNSLLKVKDVREMATLFQMSQIRGYDAFTLFGVVFGQGKIGRAFHSIATKVDRIILSIPGMLGLSFKVLFVGQDPRVAP